MQVVSHATPGPNHDVAPLGGGVAARRGRLNEAGQGSPAGPGRCDPTRILAEYDRSPRSASPLDFLAQDTFEACRIPATETGTTTPAPVSATNSCSPTRSVTRTGSRSRALRAARCSIPPTVTAAGTHRHRQARPACLATVNQSGQRHVAAQFSASTRCCVCCIPSRSDGPASTR